MAITDLTNTKWLFNDSISCEKIAQEGPFSLNFISNNGTYTNLKAQLGFNYDLYYDNTVAYLNTKNEAHWTNEAYKTIEITGGRDVADEVLINWLEANATQITSIVDIVLGSNTLTGVDTIKLTDASDDSNKIDFTYGATPSGTVNVKLGENTLVGVNEISVRGTDNISKSFGYVPSGYTATISGNHLKNVEKIWYKTDTDSNFIQYPYYFGEQLVLTNVQTIQFALTDTYLYYSQYSTGDFVGLTFTAGTSPYTYVSPIITLTQDSYLSCDGTD